MKDKKILYVEDDLSLIEGLKYTLEKNGFQVDTSCAQNSCLQRALVWQAIQLSGSGSDETVSAVRNLFPPDSSIADKRLSNSESQSSYYTGAVFIYGFLFIIALITVFNIFNSMNASVAARTRQYGVMRSIGMGAGQLYKMIAAEAVTYGTRQHHDDAELLRPCDLRFRKGRNGASGGIAESVVLLPPYYFWIQNYAEKHQDMPSISRYGKWRKSLKIQDLSPFAEI